jgi:hypothetical protein
MIVNFRTREINRGAHMLTQTLTLIKKKHRQRRPNRSASSHHKSASPTTTKDPVKIKNLISQYLSCKNQALALALAFASTTVLKLQLPVSVVFVNGNQRRWWRVFKQHVKPK